MSKGHHHHQRCHALYSGKFTESIQVSSEAIQKLDSVILSNVLLETATFSKMLLAINPTSKNFQLILPFYINFFKLYTHTYKHVYFDNFYFEEWPKKKILKAFNKIREKIYKMSWLVVLGRGPSEIIFLLSLNNNTPWKKYI